MNDLLKRTVLYKVGHHGSHNATGRSLADNKPWGLELMSSPELVAMLPVDETFANQVKHWAMPWPKLLDRLTQLTHGRVLRLDHGAPENPQPDGAWAASPARWSRRRCTCSTRCRSSDGARGSTCRTFTRSPLRGIARALNRYLTIVGK